MIAYLDLCSGISGDMLLAALVDAGADREGLQAAVSSLPLPDVRLEFAEVRRGGLRGLHATVTFPPQRQHRHLRDILRIIAESRLHPAAQRLASRMFGVLAEAEAMVHGTTVERVHFHEVGAVDSIVDVCGVAAAIVQLGITAVHASPVSTGTGTVQTEHGVMPVPAPATARLLEGMPLRECSVPAELTTPTGAAALRALDVQFGAIPAMTLVAAGYGAGSRELAGQANLLRVLTGRPMASRGAPAVQVDEVVLVETWLDDATGEQVGRARERLAALPGVLDVVVTSVQMKKGRPGVQISVLCLPAGVTTVEETLFAETPTLGVRIGRVQRHTLRRESCAVETRFGLVSGKRRCLPDGRWQFKPDHDCCQQLAVTAGVATAEVERAAQAAWESAAHSRAAGAPPLGRTESHTTESRPPRMPDTSG